MDDLNTPRALAGMHELALKLNLATTSGAARELRDQMLKGGSLLGLLTRDVDAFFTQDATLDPEDIRRLIDERAAAKAKKHYDHADAIRADLLSNGIAIEDTRDGTIWKVVKSQ